MRNIKSIFVFFLVLFGISTSLFAAGKHADIEKFLKTYEEAVVQVEKAAKTNSLTDYAKFEKKLLELSEQADKLQENDTWTLEDIKNYSELSNRYSTALMKIQASALDEAAAMEDILKAYGL